MAEDVDKKVESNLTIKENFVEGNEAAKMPRQ
jgi:hypothetical protein